MAFKRGAPIDETDHLSGSRKKHKRQLEILRSQIPTILYGYKVRSTTYELDLSRKYTLLSSRSACLFSPIFFSLSLHPLPFSLGQTKSSFVTTLGKRLTSDSQQINLDAVTHIRSAQKKQRAHVSGLSKPKTDVTDTHVQDKTSKPRTKARGKIISATKIETITAPLQDEDKPLQTDVGAVKKKRNRNKYRPDP